MKGAAAQLPAFSTAPGTLRRRQLDVVRQRKPPGGETPGYMPPYRHRPGETHRKPHYKPRPPALLSSSVFVKLVSDYLNESIVSIITLRFPLHQSPAPPPRLHPPRVSSGRRTCSGVRSAGSRGGPRLEPTEARPLHEDQRCLEASALQRVHLKQVDFLTWQGNDDPALVLELPQRLVFFSC